MAELKVYLPDGLNEKFRKIAMTVFGYGRGSLSKAAEEAFTRWCAEHDGPTTAQSSEAKKESIPQTTQGINPDERSQQKVPGQKGESSLPLPDRTNSVPQGS